jgi:hypothetical protein
MAFARTPPERAFALAKTKDYGHPLGLVDLRIALRAKDIAPPYEASPTVVTVEAPDCLRAAFRRVPRAV